MLHPTVTSEESSDAAAQSESGVGSRWKSRLESRFAPVGFWALTVAALSVAVRLPGFIRDAFWQDEVASARIISESTPLGMFRHIARSEATPPFWYALGWLANALGLSPGGFRIVSVLAGALLGGLSVILARRVLPLWASVVAGLLVAFGWQFVMHGRELRAYELFALATVIFALLLLEQAAGGRGKGHELAFVVCVALGALTSYFFLLTLGAGLIWIWTEPAVRAARRRLTRLVAIGLIPLALWSPILVSQYLNQHFDWIGPFDLSRMLGTYWLIFFEHRPATPSLGELPPPLVLLAVIAGSIVLFRRSAAGRLIVLMALVPFVLESLAWMAGARIFDPRNLIGAGVFAAITLAALLTRLPRSLAYAAAVVAVSTVAATSIRAEATPSTPYDRTARLLVSEGWTQGDPIVLFGDFFSFRDPLAWYLPGRPDLKPAESSGKPGCRAVFAIVASPRKQSAVLTREEAAVAGKAGPVLVLRLALKQIPTGAFWRRAHAMASESTSSTCARLLGDEQVASPRRLGRGGAG